MLISITEDERKIIMEFLNRTNLKGSEVIAFNAILEKIYKPVDELYTKIDNDIKV